jgi:hypothetical protein
MRAIQFAILLSLWAGAAQAETWRILHWDKFNLVAVDVEHRRTTGLSNPAFPVLELTLYAGPENEGAQLSDVKAQTSEQEVDCDDQRVRARSRRQVSGAGQPTAVTTDIEPWRDPGDERDRLLVWAVCNPHNLDTLPSVTASIEEARRAHVTAATAPQALSATADWSAAWKAMNPMGSDGIPTLLVEVLGPHPFAVASVARDGGVVLLSTAIQTVGDMRYRFQQAQVGGRLRHDATAILVMQEADCSGRRLRTLAEAGFDARMQKKFGYDTLNIGTPFQTPAEGSPDATVLQDVCGASQLIPNLPVVTSDLAGAIAAHRWLFDGDAAAAKGARDPEGWRDAYVLACAVGLCARTDDEAPSGSPDPSMPKGSPT